MQNMTDPNTLPADPHLRLAWLIEEYLRQATEEAVNHIEDILSRYGTLSYFRDRRDEQVRSFCELACTDYPTEIVRSLDDAFLIDVEREYLGQKRLYGEKYTADMRITNIMEWLGFVNSVPPIGGLKFFVSDLEESRHKLSFDRPKWRDIEECGINAFNSTVALLKLLTDFYCRALFSSDIECNVIDVNTLPKIVKRVLAPREGSWILSLNKYLEYIQELNDYLNSVDGSYFGDKCYNCFGHTSVMLDASIEFLIKLNKDRRYFAHRDKPTHNDPSVEMRSITVNIVDSLLRFSTEVRPFFPPIIIMRRKLINSRGEMRLDYYDEYGLQYDRYVEDFVEFVPYKEMFYWRRVGDSQDGILLQKPICFPIS